MKNKIIAILVVILYISLGRYIVLNEKELHPTALSIYSLFLAIAFSYGVYSIIKDIDKSTSDD